MNIFRKIVFYKRALQFLFAFNVLTLASGFSAGLGYYGSKQALVVLAEQNTERLQQLQAIQHDLFILSTDDGKDPYAVRYRLETLKNRLESWTDSSLGAFSLTDASKSGWKLDRDFRVSLYERTEKEQTRLRTELTSSLEQIGNVTRQLMLVALTTLIFGIGLPWFLFWQLNKSWQQARVKIEESFSKWLVEWHASWQRFGDKPWQDSAFWLHIGALTVETFAPKMRHPAFQFLGEFAPILRRELNKAEEMRLQEGHERSTRKKSA